MDLYYCMGGGLGHLTRFSAFCYTTGSKPAILTASPFVNDPRIVSPEIEKITPEGDVNNFESLQSWVLEQILRIKPERLYIDAFPGGILGELSSENSLFKSWAENTDTRIIYLARILNWNKYLKRLKGTLPKINEILVLEELYPDHMEFLQNLNCSIRTFDLEYKPVEFDCNFEIPGKFWLIAHSGANEELENLWCYACETAELMGVEPKFIFVSPGARPDFLPEKVIFVDYYPAESLFGRADMVFTGGGFNSVLQMKDCCEKHRALPFERALDDQFFRIKK